LKLLEGLHYGYGVEDGRYGWSVTPSEYHDPWVESPDWNREDRNEWAVYSNVFTTGREVTDINISSRDSWLPTGSTKLEKIVSRSLGKQSDGLTAWRISAEVNFLTRYAGLVPQAYMGNSSSNNMYLEVLDEDGKVIARFYTQENMVLANGKRILSGGENQMRRMFHNDTSLEILAYDGFIKVSYGGSSVVVEPGIRGEECEWQKPASVRVYYNNVGGSGGMSITLRDLTFTVK